MFFLAEFADLGCFSQILIFTHPGSGISDHGSRIQKRQQKWGVKKICCYTLLVATNFTKLEII